MTLFISFILAVGVNLLMFIPAYLFKTDKLTDISYGLSFILVAGIVLFLSDTVTLGKLILLGMITVWGVRIGAYLLIRIHKMGRDKRFDERRNSFTKFGAFWLLQGITVFAVLIASTQYLVLSITPITIVSIIGIALWATGLLIESFADYQKYTFINNPENKGKWIDTGVWKYSQHPNYFGEILLWFGVYVYTLPAIGGMMYLTGFLSPLFIAILIIFVSGIPLLRKAAEKRWGDNPEYQEYKRRTSVLVPLPQKN